MLWRKTPGYRRWGSATPRPLPPWSPVLLGVEPETVTGRGAAPLLRGAGTQGGRHPPGRGGEPARSNRTRWTCSHNVGGLDPGRSGQGLPGGAARRVPVLVDGFIPRRRLPCVPCGFVRRRGLPAGQPRLSGARRGTGLLEALGLTPFLRARIAWERAPGRRRSCLCWTWPWRSTRRWPHLMRSGGGGLPAADMIQSFQTNLTALLLGFCLDLLLGDPTGPPPGPGRGTADRGAGGAPAPRLSQNPGEESGPAVPALVVLVLSFSPWG